jgi:hypothetical protein
MVEALPACPGGDEAKGENGSGKSFSAASEKEAGGSSPGEKRF